MKSTCSVSRSTTVSARNLWLCVAVAWLSGGIGVVIPTLMTFWMRRGLTVEQIWTLQGVWAVTLALCTVPFGYLADTRGRKVCMQGGVALLLVGELAYIVGDSFWVLLGAEVLMGLGTALVSGADSSLLYDTLKVRNEEHHNAWWAGVSSAGCLFIMALGSVFGGAVAAVDDRLPFVVSSSFVALQFVAVMYLTEPRVECERRLVSFSELPKVLEFCFTPGSSQRWLIVAWSVVTVASWLAMWFYPLCFNTAGLTVNQQGSVFAFYHAVAAVASLVARRHKAHSRMPEAFLGFALLAALAHLLFGTVVGVWTFLFGVLHQIVRGAAPVVFGNALHAETPSEIRATVLSVQGACATLLYGAINLRLGAYIQAFGFQWALVAVGIGCLALATCTWMLRPAHR